MKKFDWKKFLRDCTQAYFISLGACALIAVLSRWTLGFDLLERYMEGIVILLAVTIPMGMAIFGYFGGNIWVRRLVVWLFMCPVVMGFAFFLRNGRALSGKNALILILGYTVCLTCTYLIADAIERRKLRKINEKLGENQS